MQNDHTNPDKARAELDALAARIDAAKTANEAKWSSPEFIWNRSAKKSLSAASRNIRSGYRSSVAVIDATEKSPLVRLFIGTVFLLTAAAVLFDLNDRSTQIEIAAWDLYEKTKPGTVQRTRAANLLASAGADMSGMEFNEIDLENAAIGPTKGSCFHREHSMQGVDFSPTFLFSMFPPKFGFKQTRLQGASFDCLTIKGDFTLADASESVFFKTTLNRIDFAQAELQNSDFRETNVGYPTSFNAANLGNASFANATIVGGYLPTPPGEKVPTVDFIASYLGDASFENATIRAADFTGASLDGVNFSGTTFEVDVFGLTQSELDKAWAYRGREPFGLSQFSPPLKVGHLCGPNDDREWGPDGIPTFPRTGCNKFVANDRDR